LQQHVPVLVKVITFFLGIRESYITALFLWLGSFWIGYRNGWVDIYSWVVIVIFLYILKFIYVRFIRFDEEFNCPLYSRLNYPVLGAHRGGSQSYGPENTMYNYRRCVHELGVDVLEIDLRLTTDGHIVLFHDISLNRTTNGTGLISDKSLEQLRILDAAWNYPELRGKGITIPTLEEVLEEFTKTPNIIFFFDIKDDRVVPMLPQIINHWNLTERLIVGAVFPGINKALRSTLPKTIPIAPDFTTVITWMLTYVLGISWILPTRRSMMGSHISDLTKNILTPGLISDWKRRNMKIVLFGEGLNDAESQKECIQKGVDLLLTDRPDILKEVLKRKS